MSRYSSINLSTESKVRDILRCWDTAVSRMGHFWTLGTPLFRQAGTPPLHPCFGRDGRNFIISGTCRGPGGQGLGPFLAQAGGALRRPRETLASDRTLRARLDAFCDRTLRLRFSRSHTREFRFPIACSRFAIECSRFRSHARDLQSHTRSPLSIAHSLFFIAHTRGPTDRALAAIACLPLRFSITCA